MTKQAGKAWERAAPGMLAFGVAMLLIGAGVYIASQGLADLVTSFQGLGAAAIPVAIGIGVFTLAFLGLMLALAAMVTGPQAAVAAGAVGLLLSVGAAALMIGGGVYLAASGIANLVKNVTGINVGDFVKLALGIAAVAYSLQLFAVPWMGLAILAFAAFALVLVQVAPPLTALTTALSEIATADLSGTVTQIKNIVAQVNKLDKATAMEFTTAMKSVTTAIVEVKNTPAPVLNEIANGVGQAPGPTTIIAKITLNDGEVRNLIREGSMETIGELVGEFA